MTESEIKALERALNNFDVQPLSGETLKTFFVEDFVKKTIARIKTTIRRYSRTKKILIIGHRGCGKSTILNKVSADLRDEYFTVTFSILKKLNRQDINTIDLLITTYMEILLEMEWNKITDRFDAFDKLMDPVRKKLNLTEIGVSLIKILNFKIKVEEETRKIVRSEYQTQVERLHSHLREACVDIYDKTKREPLVIIDDLDKLDTETAEKIFIRDYDLLTLDQARTVFTFPLDTHYSQLFNPVKDQYKDIFIPVMALKVGETEQTDTYDDLRQLIYKRIDSSFIDDDAVNYFIDQSGGLLRDVIRFMQNACEQALLDETLPITTDMAEEVISQATFDYIRRFDHNKYGPAADIIDRTKNRDDVDQAILIDLLKYLFALEYRSRDDIWYELHPCLKLAMEKA